MCCPGSNGNLYTGCPTKYFILDKNIRDFTKEKKNCRVEL